MSRTIAVMTTSRCFKCVPQILRSLSIDIFYCSYSSLIHNDVFDVGEIFFFINREEINPRDEDNVCLIDLSLLTKGGFCDTSVNILRSLRKSRSSEQFLEGCKQPWNFESKDQKFYIIAFLTFLSQHFDQERVSFSKVNNGVHMNCIFDRGVYLQNLLHVAMRLWC